MDDARLVKRRRTANNTLTVGGLLTLFGAYALDTNHGWVGLLWLILGLAVVAAGVVLRRRS